MAVMLSFRHCWIQMSRVKYTPEMIKFIREYAPGHWTFEIIHAFYEKFGVELSRPAIRSTLRRLNISTNAKQNRGMRELARRLTTPEQDALVREKFHDKKCGSYKEVQAFLLGLGVNFNLEQVKSYMSRKNIRLGVYGYFPKGHEPVNKGKNMSPEAYEKCKGTMFRIGNRPANFKPVGSERVNVDGYVEIKVANPNKWRIKARCIWEQVTGEKLTRNDSIVYLDGNKQNLELSNLAKVTRGQLARLNQNHLIFNNQELTKVGIALAKLLDMKGRLKK
ncbi:MAG: hypothetical protein ACI3WT_07975 [Phascolarctobacterium sp.]